MHLANTDPSRSAKQPRVVFSADVLQYSGDNHSERMQLVLTKYDILIQKKEVLMRQIELSEVEALTISDASSEVIVHCISQEDERLELGTQKSLFLKIMLYVRTMPSKCVQEQPKLPIYTVEHDQLALCVTTADDIEELRKVRPEARDRRECDYLTFIQSEPGQSPLKFKKFNSENSNKQKTGSVPISSFDFIKVLGRGAHGKVLLVRERVSSKLLAMKTIRKQHAVEAKQVEHTVCEKDILTTLKHPFIVSLCQCFNTEDKVYFTMEFMEGGELFQHLRKVKQFTEEQARFTAACLVLALGHLHDNNYIYRDLKPENVLLDARGYCKLADFGFSKRLHIDEMARTFCGTPEYMPPETILDKGCNRPGDWWSLGVLVYEMLYGVPPFYSTNTQKMYKKTLVDPLKFKKHTKCSKEAQDFIAGLLAKNPGRRLGSVADVNEVMAHPWFRNFDWNGLKSGTLDPPYKPLSDVDGWEDNFDPEFTHMKARDSITITNKSVVQPFEELFKEFDYIDPGFERELQAAQEVTSHGEAQIDQDNLQADPTEVDSNLDSSKQQNKQQAKPTGDVEPTRNKHNCCTSAGKKIVAETI